MTSRYPVIIIPFFLIIFIFNKYSAALSSSSVVKDAKKLNISENALQAILNNEIYRDADINTTKKGIQDFKFNIMGLHPNKCKRSIKYLGKYEQYQKYFDVIKKSTYNKKKQEILFRIESALLPTSIIVNFKLQRIKKPGIYDFYFNKGFLKGLTGKIIIKEYKKKCLIQSISKWNGKKTFLSDYLFEVFIETIGEHSMKKLFRLSRKL